MKTPNKTLTDACPLAPTVLPKGLSFEDRPGIPMPFLARWRDPGGRKRSRSFATYAEREAFVAAWKKQRATWGIAAPLIHPRKAEAWKIFDELTGGADPIDVARFWMKYRGERGGSIRLQEAIDRLMKRREERGLSIDRGSHIATHLKRLVEALGDKRLGDISTDEIRRWLAGLKNPKTGEEMSDYTTRNHLRDVKILFRMAAAERWCDVNPALPIQPPRREFADVSVISIQDAFKLFSANRCALCIGRLALEAFGGLRFSSAGRVAAEDILFSEKGVVMPGHKHKSGRRHYVDGYPENLWKWLKHAPSACWDITPRNYAKLKAEAFTRAGVTNPGNVLRHSFCSYHIAVNKDAARTAVLLTHRSPAMLYQHYKGRASEADGKRYFDITP